MTLNLKLSDHPDRAYKKSPMELELVQQEVSSLPPINEGDVAIDGAYIVEGEDTVEVGIYLRNALSQIICFGKTPLKITNSKGESLLKETIDLSVLKDIPPLSVRPYEIFFKKNELNGSINNEDWKIDFNSNIGESPYLLVIDDKEPVPLTEEQMSRLQNFLVTLKPLESNKVNVSPYDITRENNGQLKVTLFIKQSLKSSISLSQFRIGVVDTKDKVVAKAVFNVDNYILEPGLFYLRTFIFPQETITKEDFDLTSWSITLL